MFDVSLMGFAGGGGLATVGHSENRLLGATGLSGRGR